ncbi:hypothetical protein SLOPH_2698, partial [Spraguea lophii 42_110]
GYSVNAIGKAFDIKTLTIYSILRIYKNEKRIEKKIAGGCKSAKLDDYQKESLILKVREPVTIPLKTPVRYTSDTHDISVGKSTIDRTLESFSFTLKRISIIPERRNNEATIIKREEFARNYFNNILEIDDKNFIFINEVGFNVSMRNKHGRSPKGMPANITTSNIRTKNIPVIASVNRYQKIDFHLIMTQ